MSIPSNKHPVFSPVSRLALPYIAFLVASEAVNRHLLAPELTWLARVFAFTWWPALLPFAVVMAGTCAPNVETIVIQVVLVVCDVYFWAWLITKIAELRGEIRRLESQNQNSSNRSSAANNPPDRDAGHGGS